MRSAALVALAALLGLPGAAQRPGDPDPSWGRGGVARTLVTQDAARLQVSDFSVLRAPSGKIVVVARSTVARPKSYFEALGAVVLRYTRNGKLDPSFGRGGIVRGPAGWREPPPPWRAELVLPDGRLLVRVEDFTFGRHSLLRLLSDGRVDRSFGVRGRAVVEIGCRRHVYEVLRQPDGKLVGLAGGCSEEDAAGPTFFRLVRLHPNGRLDRSFGDSGLASLRVGVSHFLPGEAHSLIRLPDGKFVVGGDAYPVRGRGQFALARFTRDGRLDRRFGRGGIVFSSLERALAEPASAAVLAQPRGRLLVVGCAYPLTGIRGDVAFLRYTARGAPDTAFGEDGTRMHEDVLHSDQCRLAGAARGKIVLFANDVLRFRADGALDTGFARDGVLENRGGEAVLVQPDGKLVVVGRMKRVGKRLVFVRRHLG